MIRIALIILLSLLHIGINAQTTEIDSLQLLLSKAKSSDQSELLNQIGILYSNNQEYKEALDFHQKSLSLANTNETELEALKEIGRNYIILNNAEKGLEYSLLLRHKAETYKNDQYLGLAFIQLSRIKGSMMRDVKSAEVLILKAIDILKKADNKVSLISAYNDLAIASFNQKKYNEAIEAYEKALKLARALKNDNYIRLLKSNIAGVYLEIEQFELAYQYNKEALSISNNSSDIHMEIYDYLLLSMLQQKKGQLDSAIINANFGKQLATESNSLENLAWANELLFKTHQEKGDYQKASEFAGMTLYLKDSLNQSQITAQLLEKEAEIADLIKDQKISALEKDAARQRLIRNGIILSTIAALLGVIVLYKRKKLLLSLQEKELTVLNSIKEIESKEKEMLKEKLSHKERALASKTMHIIQKNEILAELKNSISNLVNDSASIQPQINKLNRTIESNINFDDDWDKFKLHFDQVHPQFFETLKQKYPSFKNNDFRFCSYIKMGLSTKEIAQLMGVNASSIQKARYRLKKKMNLDKETNLIEFINSNI